MALCVQVLADKDRQKDIMTLQLMGAAAQNQPTSYSAPPMYMGQPVYRQTECIGAVVNGVCNGSILPNAGYHPTCYGTMLNGQCTGPMY